MKRVPSSTPPATATSASAHASQTGIPAGRRFPRSLPVQLAALCALAATSYAAAAADYTVVVMQSLTGSAAFVGVPAKDGMLLAADEINRNQELGAGNTLKVLVADDAGDRAQALQLFTRYARDPNVLMILGPTSGAVAMTAAHAANDLKLPMLTTTNALEVIKAGPWSNILTQPAMVTIPVLASYAADKMKAKNCTVIGISDIEAYMTMQKTFESEVKARGVRIGAVEAIKGTDSDFSALATKVASRDQDCVFISATAPQAANIIIQLRQAGLAPQTRIIGHTTLASPDFVKRGGKAVEGVYFIGDWVPGGTDEFSRAFATAFKARHNVDAEQWAATGYSGMRIAATALKAAGPVPTRDTVRAALSQTKDVQVVVGTGRYSYNDQRIPRTGMNVLVVKNGQFVLAP